MGVSAFPTDIDDYEDIAGAKQSEQVGGRTHDEQHDDKWAAIAAVQTKIGTGASVPALGKILKGIGVGASAWGDPDAVVVPVENLLTNGGMPIDRAVGPYTTTGSRNNDASEVLTGWYLLSDGNNIVDVAQDTTIANLPSGAQAAMKATVVTANKKFGFVKFTTRAGAMEILGRVASGRILARTHASNIISNIRIGILTWSGTADAYTLDVVNTTNWGSAGTNPTLATSWTYENTPANLALTSSWQTFDVSNVAIDTASGANVAVFIWSDDTTTTIGDELWLTDVNLVPGAAAQSIVRRHIRVESRLNKPVASVGGVTSGPTRAVTTYGDLTDMTILRNFYGGDIKVDFEGTFTHASAGTVTDVAVSLDGASEVELRSNSWSNGGYNMPIVTSALFENVAPGPHTIKIRWKLSFGTDTTTAVGTARRLTVEEK